MSKALPEMLDELERLARGAEAHSERIGDATWFSQRDIQSLLLAHPDDAAYIAAASPDAILRLVGIARAAEKVRGALGQASFALRELLPNDADAHMTVGMVEQAIAALREAIGGVK